MGGGDKCLLPLGGQPMLAHIIERLRPQVSNLLINANGDAARFTAFDLPVIEDRLKGQAGPLAAVHAGIEWARASKRGGTRAKPAWARTGGAAGSAVFARARLADGKRTAVEYLPVELLDGPFRVRTILEFHECKTSRTSGLAINRQNNLRGRRNASEVRS